MEMIGIRHGKLTLLHTSQEKREEITDTIVPSTIVGSLRTKLLPLGLKLLQNVGIQKNSSMILVINNDTTSVACILAAMEMQCICILLSYSRLQLLDFVQLQSGILTIIKVDDNRVSIETRQQHERNAPMWLQESTITELGCVCMLTSGSIGDPKLVLCSWEHMRLQGQVTYELLLQRKKKARIICATSISHAYSINAIFTLYMSPLDDTYELCFANHTDTLCQLLERASMDHKTTTTLLYGTPVTYTMLLFRSPPSSSYCIDIAYCAGSSPSIDLADNVLKHCGLRLMQNYGTSETGDIAAWDLYKHFNDSHEVIKAKSDGNIFQMNFVGCLWPGVEMKIDPETQEVVVSTPWQYLGYVTAQHFTAAELYQGKFHRTGDKGIIEVRDSLQMLWLGPRIRPKLLLDCNGAELQVQPRDIESFLINHHKEVTDALVLLPMNALSKQNLQQILYIHIVLHTSSLIKSVELETSIEKNFLLSPGTIKVEIVEYLKCSPAGKLMYASR